MLAGPSSGRRSSRLPLTILRHAARLAPSQTDTAEVAARYVDVLEREHDFWMDGIDAVRDGAAAARHVVGMGGTVLNRYWDRGETPRPESYREDFELAQALPPDRRPRLWRDLRSAAESGWDFSSRWQREPGDLATTHTTDIIPVDLNALLYAQERALSDLHAALDHRADAAHYLELAATRAEAIRRIHWDEERGAFFDFDALAGHRTDILSLATVYPLYFGVATEDQAQRVAQVVEDSLLGPGGFVTTTRTTGEQWDAPNGWAPLQWLAVRGLERYGHVALAHAGRDRWLDVNRAVYRSTGKMMEKYDVLDLSRAAGGGEYPTQDGFGWTNGVALAFLGHLAEAPVGPR